jgi:hypothetical protein
MERLVDGKGLGDALAIFRIGIIPTRLELNKGESVRAVTIDLVGGHVNEGRLRTGAASGFKEIQGTDGVGIKIVEGDLCSTIVRGLGSGVYNDRGLYFLDEGEHALPVANVDFAMLIARDGAAQALESPRSIAFGSKEDFALVVVHAQDGVASLRKVKADLGADQTARSGYKDDWLSHAMRLSCHAI